MIIRKEYKDNVTVSNYFLHEEHYKIRILQSSFGNCSAHMDVVREFHQARNGGVDWEAPVQQWSNTILLFQHSSLPITGHRHG